jgi:hypothetical protein
LPGRRSGTPAEDTGYNPDEAGVVEVRGLGMKRVAGVQGLGIAEADASGGHEANDE